MVMTNAQTNRRGPTGPAEMANTKSASDRPSSVTSPDPEPAKNKFLFIITAGARESEESCDVAEMVLRMYLKHFEKWGEVVSVLKFDPGKACGIYSAAFEVEPVAQNWNFESGIHRFVRISPFDKENRRYTSFVSVEVLKIDEDFTLVDTDLLVETYRPAAGIGGQQVGRTDAIVKMTHIPTGYWIVCSESSTWKATKNARRILTTMVSNTDMLKELHIHPSLIRSYIFHPEPKVIDHISGRETNDIEAVLNGDLD